MLRSGEYDRREALEDLRRDEALLDDDEDRSRLLLKWAGPSPNGAYGVVQTTINA